MNILLINHYAGSKAHGMEYRPYYMAREWVKAGHKVTIVAGSFSHVRSVQPRVNGSLTEEYIDGVRYLWIKVPKYSGNGAGRAINIFSFVAKLYMHKGRILKGFRPDAVIASSTYPLDMYPASHIAKWTGAKLVFEVHDLWPLSPMELGGMSARHPFIMAMQRGEDYAYRKADTVISMLGGASSHMEAHGMAKEKFNFVPNGFVVEEWLGQAKELSCEHRKVLEKLRKEGMYIVGYAGSHGVANALGSFIEGAARMKGEPAAFVLVGKGQEKENLKTLALQKGADNVLFLPPVPKEEVPQLLSMMDALFIGWQRKPIYRFGVSPNKLIDYMMASRPVIHAIDAAGDIVKESGCGLTIPPEDPAAVAGAVRKLMAMDRKELEGMGRKGREFVIRNYDYRVLASRFLKVLEKHGG